MLPYSSLSKFYDKIISDEEYSKWTDYIVSIVEKYAVKKSGVDVACGSGIVTLKLKKHGFSVVGVDVSEEMLTKARINADNEKLNVQFLRQDMKNLKLFEKASFITVINDGINYISQKDLLKTFNSFYKNLERGGALIFDVSSEYKLKNVLAGNVYGDDSEDLSYIWFNALEGDSVNLSLTFFKKDGDVYRRYEENQVQYIHKTDDIINALRSAKFNVVSVTDAYGEQIKQDTQRLLFIAIKD